MFRPLEHYFDICIEYHSIVSLHSHPVEMPRRNHYHHFIFIIIVISVLYSYLTKLMKAFNYSKIYILTICTVPIYFRSKQLYLQLMCFMASKITIFMMNRTSLSIIRHCKNKKTRKHLVLTECLLIFHFKILRTEI